MYEDEINVILIQANQLNSIVAGVYGLVMQMNQYKDQTETDVSALKALIASIDLQMTGVNGQTILLQQAVDKLADELNK